MQIRFSQTGGVRRTKLPRMHNEVDETWTVTSEQEAMSGAGGRIEHCADADLAAVFSTPDVARRLEQAWVTAYAAAERFWRSAQTAPALSSRMKELILLALHATVTALDGEAVRRHVQRALAAGATDQDVLDVLITIVPVANHALYFAVPVLIRELRAASSAGAELPPATPEAQALQEEFVRTCGFWNEQRDAIMRLMPDYFAQLSDISTVPWKSGSLSPKEHELICIAVDCSVTHTYEKGLAIHIRNALGMGATREELLEVFSLAAVTGLEGYILAAEALYSGDAG